MRIAVLSQVFIRGVFQNVDIFEHFLGLVQSTAKGNDILENIVAMHQFNGCLSKKKICDSDEAPAMIGKIKGVVVLFKNNIMNLE